MMVNTLEIYGLQKKDTLLHAAKNVIGFQGFGLRLVNVWYI